MSDEINEVELMSEKGEKPIWEPPKLETISLQVLMNKLAPARCGSGNGTWYDMGSQEG